MKTEQNSEGRSADPRHVRDAVLLQDLVRELEGRDGAYALMREHLEAARIYMVGAMPSEYDFSLQLVDELLPDIEDAAIRARIADFLKHYPTKK